MSDLYDVEVLKREARLLRLRLDLSRWETGVPVGPSFACMLLEDESAPGYEAGSRWRIDRCDADVNFNLHDHVVRVEVAVADGLPREAGKPSPGRDLDDKGGCGFVELEIELDVDGALDHLEVGQRWGTTAYDELDDGVMFGGDVEDPRQWTRG